jgi:hypothetical protein
MAISGTYYIRQGATGTGDGSNYTNAFPGIPKRLERNYLYRVAKGYYGQYENDIVVGLPYVAPFDFTVLAPANTKYVATNGNDANPGTEAEPWLTIAYAALNTAEDTKVIVKAGTYTERVDLKISGSAGKWSVFEAQGVVTMYGFAIVAADYIAIKGFNIIDNPASHTPLFKGGGVWIDGNNIYVLDNTITDFENTFGINTTYLGYEYRNNIQIENNTITQCAAGMYLSVNNLLCFDNDISDIRRGAGVQVDSDYFRAFGDTLVIRNNYMHGTLEANVGASHVDALQTYEANGYHCWNLLFERNIVEDFTDQAILCNGTGYAAPVGGHDVSHEDIYILNNVFADCGSWGSLAENTTNFVFENNTLYNMALNGVGMRNQGGVPIPYPPTGSIKNNIIHTVSNPYEIVDSPVEIGYNIIYPSHADAQATDLDGVDPLFTDATDIIGADLLPMTVLDGMIPQAGSQALTGGEGGTYIGAYSGNDKRRILLNALEVGVETIELRKATSTDNGTPGDWDNAFEGESLIGEVLQESLYIDYSTLLQAIKAFKSYTKIKIKNILGL